MKAVPRILALALLAAVATVQPAVAQNPSVVTGGGFQPAGQVLYASNFSQDPIGNFPSGLKYVRGSMEVVLVDGVPMLRSTGNGEFIIPLSAPLPQDFTLEFDFVSRNSDCCAGEELAFEGSPQLNRSAGSAWVAWHHQYAGILGGGYDFGTSTVRFSEELQGELKGQLGQIRVMMSGTSFKLWTNGRQTYNIPDLVFRRTNLLRVFLGGVDDATGAVYLARVRLATGGPLAGVVAANPPPAPAPSPVPPPLLAPAPSPAPAPPAPASQSQASTGSPVPTVVAGVSVSQGPAGPIVTWLAVAAPAVYTVQRGKIDDPICCNNTSPASPPLTGPPWQDSPLPRAGTYVYTVAVTTSAGSASGQAQFVYFKSPGQIATVAPSGGPAPGSRPVATPVTPPPAPISAVPAAPPTGTTAPMPAPPPPGVRGTARPLPAAVPITETSTTLAPPTGLTIAGTPATATLTWQAPQGWTPTGYTVHRSTVGTSLTVSLTTTAIAATRYDDRSGFTAGMTYQYVVTALSSNLKAFATAQAQFLPPPPRNVSNVIAQQTGSVVAVSWAGVPNAAKYVITGASGAMFREVAGTQTLITYANLAPGTYSWSVGARYEPGAIETPASTWPSVTLSVLDAQPVLAEGKLYKEASRPEVYLLLDGKKIHIPTPDALRLMGYSFSDVTTVIDGVLGGWKLFQFASGSPTPGSVVFPPKREYHPLTGIPGATRVMSQGVEIQVGELRGWLRATGKMGGCDEGDVKYSLEVDSEWARRQGIDLHAILRVGNMGLSGAAIWYPGSAPRRIIATPIIETEFNSFTWQNRFTDNAQRPADWNSPRDCPEGIRFFPFSPDLPDVDLTSVPDGNNIVANERGPYVRIVGSLVTDSPHTRDDWDWATWWSRYFASPFANTSDDWSGAAMDWHPGVDVLHDPLHHARWTEIHPPDLIALVARDPAMPLVTMRGLAMVARPTECQSALVLIAPDWPRPSPTSVVAWEELRGPETFWPVGENAQNGAWVTDQGDSILVRAMVCGGGLGGSPGRFKAFYRVWWK